MAELKALPSLIINLLNLRADEVFDKISILTLYFISTVDLSA